MLDRARLKYPFGAPGAGTDVLWRCEARGYSVILDPDADLYASSDSELEMQWWRIVKRTHCGARLECGKFVNLQARKKWACNTQEEAIQAFIARKKRQVSILKEKLARAKADLALAISS